MIREYIYAALFACWVFSTIGVGVWQRHDGALAQASKDQERFNQISADVLKQQKEANDIISRAAADQAALAQERDQFKTQLEAEHAQNQAISNALRDQYAHLQLRFQSAENRCGPSGASAVSTTSSTSLPTAPAECVIPDAIAGNLRQLTADADTLADNYRTCYQFVKGTK